MERSNLFEALAKYDYKTMIQLYAEEGMDSLRSMHNWIHIQQNISCSAGAFIRKECQTRKL